MCTIFLTYNLQKHTIKLHVSFDIDLITKITKEDLYIMVANTSKYFTKRTQKSPNAE